VRWENGEDVRESPMSRFPRHMRGKHRAGSDSEKLFPLSKNMKGGIPYGGTLLLSLASENEAQIEHEIGLRAKSLLVRAQSSWRLIHPLKHLIQLFARCPARMRSETVRDFQTPFL